MLWDAKDSVVEDLESAVRFTDLQVRTDACYAPAVYKPMRVVGPTPGDSLMPDTYGLCLPAMRLPSDLTRSLAPGSLVSAEGRYWRRVHGKKRPRVVPHLDGMLLHASAERKLVELLARAEAMNLPRDSVFTAGRQMTVVLSGHRLTRESAPHVFEVDSLADFRNTFKLGVDAVWLRVSEGE